MKQLMDSRTFTIASLNVRLQFLPSEKNGMWLLPSFSTFESSLADDAEIFFTLTVDDTLRPAKDKQLVRTFDTGNGDTVVYQLSDGSYQYIIRDIHNRDCCLLVTNERFTDCRCAIPGALRSIG